MVSVEQITPSSPTSFQETISTKECTENLTDRYELLPEIGRGRFAKVCRIRHLASNEVYAAKIIRRWRNGKDTLGNVLRELEVISLGAFSDHIVKMHQYFLRERDIVIVMEHAMGGDLYNLIHFGNVSLSVDSTRSILQQVLEALRFLHRYKIVHLDIKPDNVLLRRPYPDLNVALCDFGLAKHLEDQTNVRDLVGTPDYAAPEILDYNPIHLTTDIWSIGVLAYYLLTGVSPFWAPTKEETFTNVSLLRITYPDDLFGNIPSCATEFIQRLLVKNPCERPSVQQCLEDPWFAEKTESD